MILLGVLIALASGVGLWTILAALLIILIGNERNKPKK